MSEIIKFTHVFNGKDYLTFEVAKLKNTDSFGNNYTAYVNKMLETPQSQVREDAPKKTRKPRKLKLTPDGKIIPDMSTSDELPF